MQGHLVQLNTEEYNEFEGLLEKCGRKKQSFES
jgi:hypothetical protein